MVHDLQPGAQVGEYRVERLIGEGSFGRVYAAIHPVIGKPAAIKVLGFEHAAKPHQVSRFVEEARAVNRIRHRNIVDIFNHGQLPDGRHYFVMELLEGLTLTDYLKKHRRIPVVQALGLMRKVSRALDAAHAAGIAHRDLKPDNLFLTVDEDGIIHPKLLDFGIAKLMGDAPLGGHKTATGTPMGTPLYMSPEQCKGGNIDHRTDIYAFGVLAHEMLTGRLPFDASNVMEVMLAHMSREPPPMSSHAPDLPLALDAPVLAMLAKDPARRPASVGAAVDALLEAARAAGLPVPSSAEPSTAARSDGAAYAFAPEQAHDSDGARAAHAMAAGTASPVGPTVPGHPAPLVTQPSPGVAPVYATHGAWAAGAAHHAGPGQMQPYYSPAATAGYGTGGAEAGGSNVVWWVLGGGCGLVVLAILIIAVSIALVADSRSDAPDREQDSSFEDP